MDFKHIENYIKLSDETKKVVALETTRLEAEEKESKAISYFKCAKNHVFICPDFGAILHKHNKSRKLSKFNGSIFNDIHRDHNVHIFISIDYESLHDGSLNEFMKLCFRCTSKIFIHVPLGSKDIVPIIQSSMRTSLPYKLFIDKDGVPRIFFHKESFKYVNKYPSDEWEMKLARTYLVLTSNVFFHRYQYEFVDVYGGFSINEVTNQSQIQTSRG